MKVASTVLRGGKRVIVNLSQLGQQLYLFSELKLKSVGAAKASSNERKLNE